MRLFEVLTQREKDQLLKILDWHLGSEQARRIIAHPWVLDEMLSVLDPVQSSEDQGYVSEEYIDDHSPIARE